MIWQTLFGFCLVSGSVLRGLMFPLLQFECLMRFVNWNVFYRRPRQSINAFCSVFLYFLLLIICCHSCYLGRRAPEPHFCCKCRSLTHARSLYYISMYSCISEMSCFCWIVDVAALWRQCHSSLHELHYWWICCTKNLWINLTDCKISTSCIWPINLVDYIYFNVFI